MRTDPADRQKNSQWLLNPDWLICLFSVSPTGDEEFLYLKCPKQQALKSAYRLKDIPLSSTYHLSSRQAPSTSAKRMESVSRGAVLPS
jgi:hypothetical protein